MATQHALQHSTARRVSALLRSFLLIGICLLPSLGFSATSLTKAVWSTSLHTLSVGGTTTPGLQAVSIMNADTARVLGKTTSTRRGTWTIALSNLQRVPCRIAASSGGVRIAKPVVNAPANCDRGALLPISISSAAWNSNDRVLFVSGKGPRGATVTVSNAKLGTALKNARIEDNGTWRVSVAQPAVVPCSVRAQVKTTSVTHAVSSAPANCNSTTPPVSSVFKVLAANDLGMHCADLDYQVFSILPPFNVVHAQVVKRGTATAKPQLVDDTQVDVVYQATSSANDPAGSGSINKTSTNLPGIFKSNFWLQQPATSQSGQAITRTIGGSAYATLYPSVLALDPSVPNWPLNCNQSTGLCDSALQLFEPLPTDLGLPVPSPVMLYPASGSGSIHTDQQAMPGPGNTPRKFGRFDRDLPFFVNFPFGSRLPARNWFAADGIPILPVDDSGRRNAYPLMKVQALRKGGNVNTPSDVYANVSVVLPVASEADCQNCHVDPIDCADPRIPAGIGAACNGSAISKTAFTVAMIDDAPGATGEQQLLNAAKMNILRLHDAKHGRRYTSSIDGAARPCNAAANPADPNCLANQTPVQCAQCHYTPALDLAQVGPVNEPQQGLKGRQQTRHISMSRAMHSFHGEQTFEGKTLFPAMPSPAGRDKTVADNVLEQTCYQCHPGKRTQCLRGAMFSGGVVCQDCHGNMAQVGNDFTAGLPHGAGPDMSKRVPWAHEPQCQSCHTGDATQNLTGTPGTLAAADGIRLLQAYKTTTQSDGSSVASMIGAPASRFAENRATNASGATVDVLYRLSKGHGGVMCEGCHNSTHAIWPIKNPFANDNIAATQLQGHNGTLTECSTCHAPGSLGLSLNGPHGMHPVGDANWNAKHEDFAERNGNACRACHGARGEGTVLARMATTRTLQCDEGPQCSNERITLAKGTEVSCSTCHENPLR